MSLGDYVRYLRAMRGGVSTRDVMQAAGITELRVLREIEQRYREVGDDETLAKLADYFEVPLEDLKQQRSRSRKALSGFVDQAMHEKQTVHVKMRNGETLAGIIKGWDLDCLGLQRSEGGELVIVQRHAVQDWERVVEEASQERASSPDAGT